MRDLTVNEVEAVSGGLGWETGGLAEVIGSYLAASLKERVLFPNQLFVSTIFMVLMTLLLASFFMSTTSFVCHLSGFLLGLALGFTFDLVDSSFLVEDQPRTT